MTRTAPYTVAVTKLSARTTDTWRARHGVTRTSRNKIYKQSRVHGTRGGDVREGAPFLLVHGGGASAGCRGGSPPVFCLAWSARRTPHDQPLLAQCASCASSCVACRSVLGEGVGAASSHVTCLLAGSCERGGRGSAVRLHRAAPRDARQRSLSACCAPRLRGLVALSSVSRVSAACRPAATTSSAAS